MIKALIFDYSDVLGGGVIPGLMDIYPDARDQIRTLFIETFDYGKVSEVEMHQMIAETAGVSADTIKSQFADIANGLTLNKELFNMILDLKKHYKMGLLSNTAPGLIEANFPYWDNRHEYFDDVVLSCNVHMVKPDSRIYELAANNLGASPSECIFIDDSQRNVDGAIAAGMEGITYRDLESFKTELKDLLGGAKN